MGSLAAKSQNHHFVSCTPLGVLRILEEILGSTDELAFKKVALIGRSNIVGMPLNLLLNKYDAFVRLCFSKTPIEELQAIVEESDIVIAACGVPGLVRAHWLKPEAIVVDVGTNYVKVPE